MILVPQAVWVMDFVLRAVAGVHLTGMTGYMFNENIPLFVRGLSSFHGWLPFFLVWCLVRLRYDSRAFPLQSVIAVGLLFVCYFVGPVGPPPPETPNHAVNINYVFGMDDTRAQTIMAPGLWLLSMVAVNVFLFHIPTHFALKRFYPTVTT